MLAKSCLKKNIRKGKLNLAVVFGLAVIAATFLFASPHAGATGISNYYPGNFSSNVNEPSGSKFDYPNDPSQSAALDTVSNYAVSKPFYLWCEDGQHVVEQDSGGCSDGSSGQWGQRTEG